MNYFFKVFVNKFLNSYIDNFQHSQLLLSQGSVNLGKIQLKLTTINKLLAAQAVPFIIVKADIDSLQIDIPWRSNLSIKVHGVNLILEYQQQLSEPEERSDYRISIQNEIRKYKEIDEQTLQRYLKRVLLNMSIELLDCQVEVLIKQQFRLQVQLSELISNCKENDNEDGTQFHRNSHLETLLVKLIRYKDHSYSNQQLMALDYAEMTMIKEKYLDILFKLNNFNVIIEKDVNILIMEILNSLNSQPIPLQENFILQDIVSVNKGFKIHIELGNTFIQYNQLQLFLNDVKTSFKQNNTGAITLKLLYNLIHIKFKQTTLISIESKKVKGFSLHPEHQVNDSQVYIEVITKFQDRLRKIDQKINISLFSNHIIIHSAVIIHYIPIQQQLMELKEIFESNQGNEQPQQNARMDKQKQLKKEMQISLKLMKLCVTIDSVTYSLGLLIQTITEVNLRMKDQKVKQIELKNQFLQFDSKDANIIILKTIGFQQLIQFNKKSLKLTLKISLIDIKWYNQIQQFVLDIIKLIPKQKQVIAQEPKDETTKGLNMHFSLECRLLVFNLGYIIVPFSYQSNLSAQLKMISLDQNGGSFQISAWVGHALQLVQYKILETANVIVNKDSLTVSNKLQIYLSPIIISSLLRALTLFTKSTANFTLKNLTNKIIIVKINEFQLQIAQNEIKTLPPFYNLNKVDQIQIGVLIDQELIFWAAEQKFAPNQYYFSKHVIKDTFDNTEFEIMLKAKNQVLQISQLQEITQMLYNQTSLTLLVGDQKFLPNSSQKFTYDNDPIQISVIAENIQSMQVELDEAESYLSFNFIKIDDQLYNALLILNVTDLTITIRNYLKIVNLLPWEISMQSDFLLPITIDPKLNNTQLHELDYSDLINNRKNQNNSSQLLHIQNQPINCYFLNFIQEGRLALEFDRKHHMLMIFRNFKPIDSQMCFVVCKNVYQPSIKYLLVRNLTNQYFVVMKNKSRLHVFPQSDNCFEYNVQKGEKCRLFVTDPEFDLLQLLDYDTMSRLSLKVNKFQALNIHLIEICVQQQKMVGNEFRISIPKISVTIESATPLQLNLDLSLRIFSQYHIDIFIQTLALRCNKSLIQIIDLFSIIEVVNSPDLRIIILNNIFLKLKEIKISVDQELIDNLKQIISLLSMDPLYYTTEPIQNFDVLVQEQIIVMNLIIEPILLQIDIQTSILQLVNTIQLKQFKLKMKKFTSQKLKQELSQFYISSMIAKIPIISVLLSNFKNLFTLIWQSKSNDSFKYSSFFTSQVKSRETFLMQTYLNTTNKGKNLRIDDEKIQYGQQIEYLKDIQQITRGCQIGEIVVITKKEQLILDIIQHLIY